MNSLILLTLKNIRLLLRSKGSALIIIFAPLLIILLLGLSYNTDAKYGINIGIYSQSYGDDTNAFIKVLQEQEFTVTKYESIETCTLNIKKGNVHTCINLPENLKVEDNNAKEVTFYVDPSRINLVWMIQETVKTKFSFKSQEISESLTQDILTKISATKTKVDEQSNQVSTIKEKNAAASTATEAAKSSLTAIDTTTSNATYDTTSIGLLSEEMSATTEKIDEAVGKIAKANMTAKDKTEIKATLEEAKGKLANASTLITGPEPTSINNLISNLQTDLNLVKSKLTTAATNIATSGTQLETTKTTLQESITSLASVQESLNQVKANLESQKITEAKTIASPITTKIEKVGTAGTYLNYLFPALLVLVVMFSSLLLGTTLVMMEKNSPAFLRNFFLPIRKITFITSTYLTTLIMVVIEIAIILGLSLFFLEESAPILPTIALILLIAASVFTFLGMIIGYIFTSEETGVLASISLGSVLLFVSGVILPLEGISIALRNITFFNPFVVTEKLIHETFLFKTPLGDVWVDLMILVAYAVVLFLIVLILESLLHKHLIHRFMKHKHPHLRQQEKKNKNYL